MSFFFQTSLDIIIVILPNNCSFFFRFYHISWLSIRYSSKKKFRNGPILCLWMYIDTLVHAKHICIYIHSVVWLDEIEIRCWLFPSTLQLAIALSSFPFVLFWIDDMEMRLFIVRIRVIWSVKVATTRHVLTVLKWARDGWTRFPLEKYTITTTKVFFFARKRRRFKRGSDPPSEQSSSCWHFFRSKHSSVYHHGGKKSLRKKL